MLRGGSWNNNQNNARCAYRNRNHPDNWNDNVGFRCASAFPTAPRCPLLTGSRLRRGETQARSRSGGNAWAKDSAASRRRVGRLTETRCEAP
ncbi:MAG: SUMF1/EgtB/PvdO family nonheme iron enzyme [Anaerolineae bacterium]